MKPQVLSDGLPVFDASRHSLADIDAGLSPYTLNMARSNMRDRIGLDGKTFIDVVPKYLVVHPVQETYAEKLLAEISPTNFEDVNPFAGKLRLIVDPRLVDEMDSGMNWFLFADPARTPSLQYAYLAAHQGVQIQRREAWNTLGLQIRAWLDFGAGWLDWRGASKFSGLGFGGD